MVRQYAQHIECWLGGQCVLKRPRATPGDVHRHSRDIDYRHLVAALKRRHGAFARWVMRDAAFPRAVYRQTWERLAAARPEREACKTMVGLLALAADGHEAQLAGELEQLLGLDRLPNLLALARYLPIDKFGADCLFQIISHRYERGATLLTTNRVYKQWAGIFNGDATLTSALLGRLLDHVETVLIEGKSYRGQDHAEA